MVCLNLTDPAENATLGGERAQKLFEEVSHVIYGFLLPSVCAFGIVGNVLNLTILTRRKLQKSFRTLEQAANLCLISLAVSDLMFCVFAFPTMFLPENDLYTSKGVLLTYRVYSTAIINVFIMMSTWLTVAMSLERYLAICHPLRQDLYLTTRRIKIVIVLTYILSFIFNVPVLWRYEVQEICPQLLGGEEGVTTQMGSVAFRPNQVFLWGSSQLDTVYRILWAVVNNVIPLLLLVYFNVCLCRKIYRSYKMRQKFKQEHHSGHENSSHVLTITLVVIVLMFLIFVAPSEIVIHVALLTNSNNSYTYMSVEAVMNFMQSLNFSVNFILYCIISPYFRKTLKYLFCCGCYNIYQVSKQWRKEFETSLM
ncbi:FMRFamide receptor-like [Babylonia areolata]|uniref:FMRFamide receptor-like n=1 Tax=Babylonia areolata TaxID=304850 RepID=UPI003FD100E5